LSWKQKNSSCTEEQVQSENVLKTEKVFFDRGTCTVRKCLEDMENLPWKRNFSGLKMSWGQRKYSWWRNSSRLKMSWGQRKSFGLRNSSGHDSKCLAYRGSLLDRGILPDRKNLEDSESLPNRESPLDRKLFWTNKVLRTEKVLRTKELFWKENFLKTEKVFLTALLDRGTLPEIKSWGQRNPSVFRRFI
jgi:hypothetical protein